ncbi:MAG: bifunctional folylpolyglutamate synthase/dihydrofolate synthase [Muribaculaceae bacterium]|nr:bifunctional folylpolyglutamate synthase/dihydrofolate synthase [Roseburia sp.]MCM1431320.1 bifunctional folylpolyglutamate synthase/dihydrofolate synthase [Muribaculaceae bacterium]MCM1492194.1 bifunctional folylpolyglutamate synthase/dihydrofolate synthase [Muribaculaceae bacterium]
MEYSYSEVLEKIENSRRFGRLPGVTVEGLMLEALGEPQRGLPYIHVAGTNGKGSVCAFLDGILRELGLRVGRFTSPHLVDFRERIMVDHALIEKEAVERLGNRLLQLDAGVTPTMFDYCLAMAILYFKERECDIAVIETGLGGRLDSTNALGNPEVAVITRIDLDHTAVLGDSLTDIAEEKAGIFRAGVPAVSAPQEEEAMAVLWPRAGSLHVVTEEELEKAKAYQPGLLGLHQIENAAVAAAAVRALSSVHTRRAGEAEAAMTRRAEKLETSIAWGIHSARWPGRMELLCERPFFLVDGAHNPGGVRALRESLRQLYPQESFRFVMAVMEDKDYTGMVELLLPLAEEFVTVSLDEERALQGEKLAEYIRERGVFARAAGSVRELCTLPADGTKTVALGSLYFIGEIKRLFPAPCGS